LGFIYHGPSNHYFYNWLDKQFPGTDDTSVVIKVAIDQFFWCPISMSVFFAYLGFVNGDSLSTIGRKIKSNLLMVCERTWRVWTAFHVVNFTFVGNKWRITYINAVQIAFGFLSPRGTKKLA
ncbi:hypothetical protein ACHAWF_014520, partial [Thalassiosira exigua]